MREAARGYGPMLAISDRLREVGVGTPLLLALIAFVLHCRWSRGWLRAVAVLSLIALVPASLIALLMVGMGGPTTLDSVRLRNGHRYILAIEPVPTDSVYTLYEPADVFGFVWRKASWLDYSEDGRFTGGERLRLSADEQWLLVGRGGLWTDCFTLRGGRPVDCGVPLEADWDEPGYDLAMRKRSAGIARLAAMRP